MTNPIINTTYDAEQSVLGALILSSKLPSDRISKIFSLLTPTSFAVRQHQIIFDAMNRMHNNNAAIDLVTLEMVLTEMKSISNVGGIAYLSDLARNLPSSANVMAYVDIVRNESIKQSAIKELNDCLDKISNGLSVDLESALSDLEAKISSISNSVIISQPTNGPKHASEIASKWLSGVESRIENPAVYGGKTTGISELDKILHPVMLPQNALVIVGARPKMGKSAFLTSIIKHFTLDLNEKSLLFSLEMTEEMIFERFVLNKSRVHPEHLHASSFNTDSMAKASKAAGQYARSHLYIDDTANVNINYIKHQARKLNKDGKLALIGLDYLTLMKAEKADRNDLAYGAITRDLKNLAKELDCIILLIIQLNRSLENRPNKRPMPSDGRDTGQIEQDCDIWIGLYRESTYQSVPKGCEGITEAIVRLNRNGKTGTAHLDMKEGYFIDAKPIPQVSYSQVNRDDF